MSAKAICNTRLYKPNTVYIHPSIKPYAPSLVFSCLCPIQNSGAVQYELRQQRAASHNYFHGRCGERSDFGKLHDD